MLAGGAALTYFAWRDATTGEYAMTPTVFGPMLVALGIGLLVHATGIAIGGINTRTRLYGLAGVAGTVALLAAYGFFSRPAGSSRAVWLAESAVPFALGIYWLLPKRWLGGEPHDPLAGAIAAAEADRAAREAQRAQDSPPASSTAAPPRKPATSSTRTRRDRR